MLGSSEAYSHKMYQKLSLYKIAHLNTMAIFLQMTRDRFLARFCNIFAYFCMKLHTNSLSEKKKSHFDFFSFHAAKSLLPTCCPFRDIQTILHDWFSDYFCATIRFLYNCWKPVFEICIIGKICRKNYMSIACFFVSVSLSLH